MYDLLIFLKKMWQTSKLLSVENEIPVPHGTIL
jgi:hypothetical protein